MEDVVTELTGLQDAIPALRRHSLALLRDRTEADDLVQHTLAPMRAVDTTGVSGFARSRRGLGISLVADGMAEGVQALSDRVRDEMAAAS